jgi:hypothetical protein
MNPSEIRTALLESIPDAPPASYTVQSLLADSARRRRRRSLAAAGTSLVAVGVVLVSVLVVPDVVRDREAKPAATPLGPAGQPWYELDPSRYCDAAESTMTPEQVATIYQSFAEPHPVEAPDTIANRIGCYLLQVVPDRLPGAVFYANPYDMVPAPPDELFDEQPLAIVFGPPPGPPHDPMAVVVSATAMVADVDGVGSIEFRTYLADDWSPQDMADHCRDRPTQCELRTGPHGEVVGVWTTVEPDGYRLVNVDVHLGRSIAMAVVTNADPSVRPWHSAATESGHRVGRPEPPLSVDELIEILASPQLALR